MPFRDDIDAAYARLEVLEIENSKLVEENARLLCIVAPAKPRVPNNHAAVLTRIEELERVNPRLAEKNEQLRKRPPLEPARQPQPEKPQPRRSKRRRDDRDEEVRTALKLAGTLLRLLIR